MTRPTSPTAVAVGSVFVFAGLVAALWWRGYDSRPDRLVVYAAPTVRLPLEAIAEDYERETGRGVELRFGPSEDILTKVRLANPAEPGDLFIPADDSYVRQARELGLTGESLPVTRIRAVLLLAKGNPRGIAGWDDLLAPGAKVAVPSPSAAVGKLARDHLADTKKWGSLAPHVVDSGSVTEAANATRAGDRPAIDAAIVWDAVAAGPAFRGQTVLAVPELAGVTGRIEMVVLKQSRDPAAALAFARFVTAPDRGLRRFREAGFRVGERP